MSGGANCPETPRQKMIGMMYLFLTAMLAINVSKTILNAFVVVNTSLEKTNKTFDSKNDYMYNLLAQAKLNDPKAYPYYEASLKVQKLAKDMNEYILKDRGELLNMVDKNISVEEGKTFPLKELEAKDNYDIPTHYFLGQSVDGSQGEARKLKNKLIEYKKKLIDLLKDPKIILPNKEEKIAKLGDLGIDTDDPEEKNPDNPEENYWETSKFDHTPVAAAVAILSQIQNQVKNAEATILNKLLGGIGSTDFKFDTLAAKAIPKSNYVIQGGEYEADIFVAAFSKSSKPKVWIGERIDTVNGEIKISGNPFGNNGQPDTIPVVNGMGKLKIPASTFATMKLSNNIPYDKVIKYSQDMEINLAWLFDIKQNSKVK
jgi:gliding motility-associated protein GldM